MSELNTEMQYKIHIAYLIKEYRACRESLWCERLPARALECFSDVSPHSAMMEAKAKYYRRTEEVCKGGE